MSDAGGGTLSGRGSAGLALPLRAAALGLLTGLVLGAFEGIERGVGLRALLGGVGGAARYLLLTVGYDALAGCALGLAAGCALAAGRALERRIGLAGAPRRALRGALAGLIGAGWTLYALTFTVRFDPLLARAPLALATAVAAGAAAGLAWSGIRPLLAPGARRPWNRLTAAALGMGLLVLYAVDVHFAPQSSYGVHMLLDTALFGGVALILLLLPRPRGRHAIVGGVAALALTWATDHVARTSPEVTALLKFRGVTARRSVNLLGRGLDWDRDGWTPRPLVAGWDTAPLDPRVPPPVLPPMAAVDRDPALADTGRDAPRFATRPNLLLVTLDACRLDVLDRGAHTDSPLGDLQPATPTLDSLARHAAVFEACYSHAAGTLDSFNSLFAGDYLPALLRGVEPGRYLPERLAHAGYALRARANYDSFADSAYGWPQIVHGEGDTPELIRQAVAGLAAPGEGPPGFVWFHFLDIHSGVLNPFRPASYRRRSQIQRYAQGLAKVDALSGLLFAELRARGLERSTIVVVSADHGEELGEHGHFNHNLTLYEPAVRVPLMVSGPGVVPGPRPGTVAQVDLYPTLLLAAGIAPGPGPGRSLWPVLADPLRRPEARRIYLFHPRRGFSRRFAALPPDRGQVALVDPVARRKIILGLDRETVEVFALAADPGERVNRVGMRDPWIAPLRAVLDSTLARYAAPQRGIEP